MKKYIIPGVNYGRDLDAAIPGAPNFKYWEVVSSVTAVRLGIKNIPSEAQWKAAEYVAANLLQPLRNDHGPITASSWFRNQELNAAIGSGATSFHLTGSGIDLEPGECSLMELLEGAYKLKFSEIIAEFFPHGWVHAALKEGDNRRMLKLKDPTSNYKRVTIEDLRKKYPKDKA